jgi:hypothetical protein
MEQQKMLSKKGLFLTSIKNEHHFPLEPTNNDLPDWQL